MKKVLLILAGAFSLSGFAQTILLTDMTTTTALAPNDTIYLTTEAESDIHILIDIKNTGSTQNVYKVKREDILLNGTAYAYFCFGGECYVETVTVSPDATTLTPGQSATQIPGTFNALTAYLMESTTVGKSIVSYTVFNVADPNNDFRKVTIKYNYPKPVGIKETSKSISSFEIFPNPAKETAFVLLNSQKSFESSLVLFNSLGQAVYEKEIHITEGKNKIEMGVGNLQAGVYFASIKTSSGSVSKKIVVN